MTLPASLTNQPEPAAQASSSAHRAWTIAAIVVFGWGINFVFAKHALNQFDLATFNVFRFTGMAALGWIVIAITRQIRPIEPHHHKPMLLVAFVGFVCYVFGFSVGLNFTSAFSASLLLALVPLWVLAITATQKRQIPPARSLVAVGLAATGTTLFVTTRTSISLGWGDLVSVAVAAAYATYLLMNRKLVDHYPPLTLTTYGASIAAVPIVAATVWQLPNQDWSAVTTNGWLAILWVIVVPVFIAWSVWNWVLQRLEPTQVAPPALRRASHQRTGRVAHPRRNNRTRADRRHRSRHHRPHPQPTPPDLVHHQRTPRDRLDFTTSKLLPDTARSKAAITPPSTARRCSITCTRMLDVEQVGLQHWSQ